jgi:hypothetical protein
MGASSAGLWPWLTLAGLGAFHGLNPGMGWLFAVALGLHRKRRRIVWLSLLPIAVGHAASVVAVAAAFVWAGFVLDARIVKVGAGLTLIGWGLYHWRYGHRHPVRIGMQTGLAGLGIWSFLMATGHGAGLMLWPALMPICFPAGAEQGLGRPIAAAALGIGVHTLAMLAVTAAIAILVYEWLDLEFLRRAWINLDLVWAVALIGAGLVLMLS